MPLQTAAQTLRLGPNLNNYASHNDHNDNIMTHWQLLSDRWFQQITPRSHNARTVRNWRFTTMVQQPQTTHDNSLHDSKHKGTEVKTISRWYKGNNTSGERTKLSEHPEWVKITYLKSLTNFPKAHDDQQVQKSPRYDIQNSLNNQHFEISHDYIAIFINLYLNIRMESYNIK